MTTRKALPSILGASLLLVFSSSHAAPTAARLWNEELLAAIRINLPNPPAHARNLFHCSVAMYNSWAAYDATAVGYIYNEKVSPLPPDVEEAREEAISFAAYRLLRARFASGPGSITTLANLDTRLRALYGNDAPSLAQAATNASTAPAEVGKRIGQAVLNWSALDGFTSTAYPQSYSAAVNPNLNVALPALGTLIIDGFDRFDMPLGHGIPSNTNPNFWQPLSMSTGTTQNGIPIPGGVQSFVGVQGLATVPFSLTRQDPVKPWIDPGNGPYRLTTPSATSATSAMYQAEALDVIKSSAELNAPTLIDICPAAIGNNALGTDSGSGFTTNPVTNTPYTPHLIPIGDYRRVLAEFWADGPNSETPPGHWHVLANQVSDDPLTVKKLRGQGAIVNDLEWDVKLYFALAASTHDAACAAWSLKRYYSGPRPITMIRHMATLGQSSLPAGQFYHPQGMPLEDGITDQIDEAETDEATDKFWRVWDVREAKQVPGAWHIGEIVCYSWPGEHQQNLPAPSIATHRSDVQWMLARHWLPFQRKTFNTPAFPGYISGHSTFSRAAAEMLTLFTGSPYFPGGYHDHTVAANSLQIDLGPSVPVTLQWCTYFDAADQAGQSRRWGGIHPKQDDYDGRQVGSTAGKTAFSLAEKYWTGTIAGESMTPSISFLPNGHVKVTWTAVRGMHHRLQTTTVDMTSWTDVGSYVQAYDTNGSYTDTNPAPGRKFYRVLRTANPYPNP